MRAIALTLVVSAALALPAIAATTPEDHTAAAVIAADKGWTKAEMTGDVAFVDALLLPDYRSIGSNGKIYDKAAILASTRKASPERAAMIAKWQADHPLLKSADIVGDTAILSFTLQSAADPKPVLSCDIFVYREGRWRALYSQHSTAESDIAPRLATSPPPAANQ